MSVNLAARLEALAKPGEICISRALKEQVQENLGVQVLDAGSHRVKNLSQPVRVYRVLAVPLSRAAALQVSVAVTLATISRWLAAADFNRDGRMDLVAAGNSQGPVFMLGKGDGTFQAPILIPGSSASTVARP